VTGFTSPGINNDIMERELTHCNKCQNILQTATKEGQLPKDEDIAICPFCGTISRYEVNGPIIKLNASCEQDLEDIKDTKPEIYKVFKMLVEYAIQLSNAQN
jgi:RNase P subunit RPR2